MSQLARIIHALGMSRARLIGIDGDVGAGKTTFADQLSAQIRCPCVHLDSFLNRGNATFLPNIQYDSLQAIIADQEGTIVVEGVCLLAVLERISLAPDFLIFVDSENCERTSKSSNLLSREIQTYFAEYSPRSRANSIISPRALTMNSSYDVDIAYIRSKTIISVALAIGGLLQSIAGTLLLNTGLNQQGTASLKIMGAEISATGLGGIVLCTSVLWAYFAYLARPKFSSRSERRNTKNADGSSEDYEFRSSTVVAVNPQRRARQAAQTDQPGSDDVTS